MMADIRREDARPIRASGCAGAKSAMGGRTDGSRILLPAEERAKDSGLSHCVRKREIDREKGKVESGEEEDRDEEKTDSERRFSESKAQKKPCQSTSHDPGFGHGALFEHHRSIHELLRISLISFTYRVFSFIVYIYSIYTSAAYTHCFSR